MLLRFLRRSAVGLVIMVPLAIFIWAITGRDTGWTHDGLGLVAYLIVAGAVLFGMTELVRGTVERKRPGATRTGIFIRSFAGLLLVLALCWAFSAGLLIWTYGYEVVASVDATREIVAAAVFTVGLSVSHAVQQTFFPKST